MPDSKLKKPRTIHFTAMPDSGISEEDRQKLADGLSRLLSGTYVLLGKTHGFHWNVVGPQFKALHDLFQAQYEELQLAVDEIAERVRALGHFAPNGLSKMLQLSPISDADPVYDANGMLEALVLDHETITRLCREVSKVCDEAHDPVSQDLLNARMAVHEKTAWMLRALTT